MWWFFKECVCYLSLLHPPVHQVLFDVGQEWAKKRAHEVKAENDGKDVIDHVFSCELAPMIQKWIKLAHTPGVLVSDISEMQRPLVQDVLTGKLVARPFATVAYCGWVCHQACPGGVYFWKPFCPFCCAESPLSVIKDAVARLTWSQPWVVSWVYLAHRQPLVSSRTYNCTRPWKKLFIFERLHCNGTKY